MSRSVDGRVRWGLRAGLPVLALALAWSGAPAPGAEPAGPDYWLAYGKPVRLCPGAREPVPAKVEGQSWGVLAGGALLCRDEGDAYVLTLDYLNVSVDPAGRAALPRDAVAFDWLGLSLYRPARQGGGVDWLLDAALPVKGTLDRRATGRIVFGHLAFRVPKDTAREATNMLLYLTLGSPLVALHVS